MMSIDNFIFDQLIINNERSIETAPKFNDRRINDLEFVDSLRIRLNKNISKD